jgi:hypothetical protein
VKSTRVVLRDSSIAPGATLGTRSSHSTFSGLQQHKLGACENCSLSHPTQPPGDSGAVPGLCVTSPGGSDVG